MTRKFFYILIASFSVCACLYGCSQKKSEAESVQADSVTTEQRAAQAHEDSARVAAETAKDDSAAALEVKDFMSPVDTIDWVKSAQLGTPENKLIAETCALLARQERIPRLSDVSDEQYAIAQVSQSDFVNARRSFSARLGKNLVNVFQIPRSVRARQIIGDCQYSLDEGDFVFQKIVEALRDAEMTPESVGTTSAKLRELVRLDFRSEIAALRAAGDSSDSGRNLEMVAGLAVCKEWNFTPEEVGLSLKEVPNCGGQGEGG